MDLAQVMQQIADRLDTIDGLRTHAHPMGSVTPPAAIVSYPEVIDYDQTYQRGEDHLTLPLVVVVGRPYDRGTRDALAPYVNGSGPSSVKAVLEAGDFTAFATVEVQRCEFDVLSIGGVDYMAALFTLDISGSGS